jgi:predicted nucleic acid-binding Zn ribbon protein
MPTYVYKFIDSGRIIEVQQAFTDDPFTSLIDPTDGRLLPVKKIFTPVGVSFKGTGFYKTDSRSKTSSSRAAGFTPTSSKSDSPSNGDLPASVATAGSTEASSSQTRTPDASTPASTPTGTPATSTN